jgi:glycosyltransferase involved in cell wall biosynthesis
MRTKPIISILIPVRNGESHIAETLDKVYQIPGVEIVVSDNHSLDGTLEVVRKYKNIRIVRPEQSLSMVENWNFVTSNASADFYKVVSHDDLVNVNSFSAQIKALEVNPLAVFAYSTRDLLFETSRRKLKLKSRAPKCEKIVLEALTLLKMVCRSGTNPVGETLCVTFRTSQMSLSESWVDIEMIYELETYTRALRKGPAILVPGKAGCFRIHSGSYTASISNFFRMAKKIRDWTQDQPEYLSLSARDKVLLQISTRLAAVKKFFIFFALKFL